MSDDIINLDDEAPEAVSLQRSENRRENADGTVTIELQYPVDVKFRQNNQERSERITELTVHRANGAFLRQLIRHHKDEEKALVLVFTSLTRQPEAVLDKLDAADFMAFYAEVEGLLGKFLPAGKN